MAAVRLHVLAQRRDLVRQVIGDDRHRAVGNAGRHGREACGLRRGNDLVGPRRRRNVDVDDGVAQQCIAHRAADRACLEAACGERREHGPSLGTDEPVRAGEARQLAGGCGSHHGWCAT
jgi:hypothetical protein